MHALDQRRRFGGSLDQADRERARAEHADEEQRQQAVDHLPRKRPSAGKPSAQTPAGTRAVDEARAVDTIRHCT